MENVKNERTVIPLAAAAHWYFTKEIDGNFFVASTTMFFCSHNFVNSICFDIATETSTIR